MERFSAFAECWIENFGCCGSVVGAEEVQSVFGSVPCDHFFDGGLSFDGPFEAFETVIPWFCDDKVFDGEFTGQRSGDDLE